MTWRGHDDVAQLVLYYCQSSIIVDKLVVPVTMAVLPLSESNETEACSR